VRDRRVSLVPATAIGAGVVFGYLIVAAVQEAFTPTHGTGLLSVVFDDATVQEKLRVALYSDPSAFAVVLCAAMIPVLFVRMLRQVRVLLKDDFRDRVSEEERAALDKSVGTFNATMRALGSRVTTGVVACLAAAAAVLVSVASYNRGPLAGVLHTIEFVGDNAQPKQLPIGQVPTDWWLNFDRQPLASLGFVSLLTFAIFVIIKHALCSGVLLWLLLGIRKIRWVASIDPYNTDGAFGLTPLRRVLTNQVALVATELLGVSIIALLWFGHGVLAVGAVATAVLVGVLAIGMPMALAAEGIGRAKRECMRAIQSDLDGLEELVRRSAMRNAPEKSSEVLFQYWKTLRERHDSLVRVPNMGFKVREFLLSTTTMLVIPILLLVTKDWIGVK
jgi:hypothetical protein